MKGDAMNRIGKKEIAPDAARLFENEILRLQRDIPREELCALVDDYVYYQTDGMTRQEARAVVDETCRARKQG
jgi:hypothetical protein